MEETRNTATKGDDLTGLPVLIPNNETVQHPIDIEIVDETAELHDVSKEYLHGALNAVSDHFNENREEQLDIYRRYAERYLNVTTDETDEILVVAVDHAMPVNLKKIGIYARYYEAVRVAHRTQANRVSELGHSETNVIVMKKKKGE